MTQRSRVQIPPATNISDGRRAGLTAGGRQHLPDVSDRLQQAIVGRNKDPVKELASLTIAWSPRPARTAPISSSTCRPAVTT